MTLTPNTLDPLVQEQLDGRAACWHHYLGGEIPLDRCLVGATQFLGYRSWEALLEDYAVTVAPPEEEFDPERMKTRWLDWLRDPEGHGGKTEGRRVLLALAAFTHRHGLKDFQVTTSEPGKGALILWRDGNSDHPLTISEKAAEILYRWAGHPRTAMTPTYRHFLVSPAPLGTFLFDGKGTDEGCSLTCSAKRAKVEKAGDVPGNLAGAQRFFESMLSHQRAKRAKPPITMASSRPKVRP